MISISEIKYFIDTDKVSDKKLHAQKGLDYYEGNHDIRNYKLYYFDDDGNLVEDTTRSNERISHPFFRELTDQCAQYLLSGDTEIVRSDDATLQKYLDEYFDDEFKAELLDLVTYAGIEGFSYLYRYMGNDYKSKFKFADGLNVVEVPSKYTSDKKDYVIYWYYYKTEKNIPVYKIEVWDDTQCYFYVMKNDNIKEDKENKPRYHVQYKEDNKNYYDTFGEVPFVRLDNNRNQFSDLKVIKDLIDDYDLMSCGLSNNIQDMAEGFYVVKGFQGHNMDELTQAIRTKKQVGVGENGDVDIKTVQIPYEARRIKLELDEKNIYRFGMGFDSSKAEASNVTNVVIKSRYALLDLKANKKEIQLKKMLSKILKIVVEEINKRYDVAYDFKDAYIVFDRVVPSNELDNANIELINANIKQVKINTLLNVQTVIDNETLLKNICDVLDIDIDDVKVEEEPLPIDEVNKIVEDEPIE